MPDEDLLSTETLHNNSEKKKNIMGTNKLCEFKIFARLVQQEIFFDVRTSQSL